MDYNLALNFLFNRLQSFHNDGASAYKPGLEKALTLSEAFDNPHKKFKSIHIGGTNGKGSTAHSLASVLMASGLKVGLYTSPHLVDFNERIRIDGKPINHREVIQFIESYLSKNIKNTDPSFFELTTIMAFDHFARHNVDVAVIEVGLGGRLDTTNIITPELSIITNISYDHTALLGNTLSEIATEKAGIIKPDVPAIIGRRNIETDAVFLDKCKDVIFAQDKPLFSEVKNFPEELLYKNTPWGDIKSRLTGECQPENMQTILTALNVIQKKKLFTFGSRHVQLGLQEVATNTGLMGRWMLLNKQPKIIADTAHNPDGWNFIVKRLSQQKQSSLHMVIGFVNDKDYKTILSMLPKKANYYFVEPSVRRAAKTEEIKMTAKEFGIEGDIYYDVVSGYKEALKASSYDPESLIYIGGSTFVVADLLSHLQ